MQNITKPFAPFCAVIHQIKAEINPWTHSLFVYVGADAYEQARQSWQNGTCCICIPPTRRVTDYQWSVQEMSLVIVDTGSMTGLGLKRMAHDLLMQGAKIVAIHSINFNGIEIYKRQKDLINEHNQPNQPR